MFRSSIHLTTTSFDHRASTSRSKSQRPVELLVMMKGLTALITCYADRLTWTGSIPKLRWLCSSLNTVVYFNIVESQEGLAWIASKIQRTASAYVVFQLNYLASKFLFWSFQTCCINYFSRCIFFLLNTSDFPYNDASFQVKYWNVYLTS